MNAVRERTFEDSIAERGVTPLLFGIIGPSGSGKTYSALRLATGMQRVIGGEIFVIDTEADRAKHYARMFRFRHVPFAAPFAPGDYLAAIKHCVSRGAKTIVIDSMSHEHEGPGGVLEWHQREVERIMAAWRCTEEKANVPAWGKPKAARRELINYYMQVKCNFIFCFRAKDKIKIGSGKVTQMGFMPIAGEEHVFELTAKSLLLPGASGVPTWSSDQVGEKMMIKLPEQFRGLFSGAAGKPLDESIGETLARWAVGEEVLSPAENLAAQYVTCADDAAFKVLESKRAEMWKAASAADKITLKGASDNAAKRIAALAAHPNPDPTPATTVTRTENPRSDATPADGPNDTPGWVSLLTAQTDLLELERVWKECLSFFEGEVANECDAAYQTRKESLSTATEKELEF
jgi:hypothetical protein